MDGWMADTQLPPICLFPSFMAGRSMIIELNKAPKAVTRRHKILKV